MSEKCKICDVRLIVEGGYYVCRSCGLQKGMFLCARTSQRTCELSPTYTHFKIPYTRLRRFSRLVKRLIGIGPAIDPEIIVYVQKQKPRNYGDVMRCVRSYRKDTGMKPVCFSRIPMVYTLVMGTRTPTLSPEEIRLLEFAFRIVDQERYSQKMIKFPYNFILPRLLRLPHIKKYIGARAEAVAEMVKPLSCRHRTSLYDRQLQELLSKKLFGEK